MAATVALVALGAAVLPLRSSGSHSPSSTVVLLPPPGGVPLSYHIVYRVKTGTGVSTEELWVHRPFEAEDPRLLAPDRQRYLHALARHAMRELSAYGARASAES